MLNLDMLLSVTSGSEIENTNLFPFPFPLHLGFVVISLIFFIFRFATDKKPFQLIMAVAIPFSMTIWLSASKTWFYTVGAVEFVLILAAAVSVFVFKDKKKTAAASDDKNEAPEDADDKE